MPEAAKKPEAKPVAKAAPKPAPKKPSPIAPFEALGEFTNDRVLCCARFSPCGKYVVAGGTTGLVHRWEIGKAAETDADEFKPLADLPGHGGWVQCVTFAPTGTTVFTADSWGKLAAWDYAAAKPKSLWVIDEAHAAWIRNVAVAPDGKLLATAGRDGHVKLWDAATGKPLADLADHGEDVYSVAFSPDGKTLASGDFFGTIKLWDVATRKPLRDLDGKLFAALERLQDVGGVRILQFTPDGKSLAAAGLQPSNGGTVQGIPTLVFFDLATDKQTKRFEFGLAKDGFVSDLVVHPAGDWILTTSGVTGNGKLLLLKPTADAPHAETTKLANLHSASLHPDGRRVIVVACNSRNSGNGAVKNKETMAYESNWSPVKVVELPAGATA